MTRSYLLTDSSSAMLFDGSLVDTWDIRMVGSVLSARTRLITPGRLYTFIIRQQNTSYRFAWPATCLNAPTVNPQPNSVVVQNFVGQAAGLLQATPPGTAF